MPEYLAPAVYVEETSFRSKSIEGVSTSTAAFVGPTRKGPTSGTPEIITSFGDYERMYGGFHNLEFSAGESTNFIAHAVKNFFDNGGSRLFIARVFQAAASSTGIASSSTTFDASSMRFVARFPGAVGNGSVEVGLVLTRLDTTALDSPAMRRAPQGSVLVDGLPSFDPADPDVLSGSLDQYIKIGEQWLDGPDPATATAISATPSTAAALMSINILTRDADGEEIFYENLGLSAGHPRYVGDILSTNPGRRIDQLQNAFAIEIGTSVDGFGLYALLDTLLNGNASVTVDLDGGDDGVMPAAAQYVTPLLSLAANDDISMVAAPGYSSYTEREGIQDALLTHVEARRAYRFAVLDVPIDQTPMAAVSIKSRIDSSYAALYHPWVVTSNPLSRPDDSSIPREIALPPSGFVCGIFARNDNTKGVSKSPGNEIVRGALRFQTQISFAEQELLNPRGVNCLRFFPGRGNRLWGSRTASSDPEWKYIGPRRFFLYLEHSIDRSTQWAVFENNGPQLWTNIRETVSGFLYNEWRNNNLLGSTPEEAFFVRCDRTTMTQNDLDNGRLICLIGVSVLKPAEFVVFRIGQKTADSRD